MRVVWVNNGEPDEDGFITVQIVNGLGAVTSTFKAKSKAELVDPLLEAQVNANRRLGQILGKPDKANPPQAQDFSAEERLRYATSVTDPSKVVETVTEIADRRFKSKEESDAYYREEGLAFIAEHPEYYPSPKNQNALFRALMDRSYDLTRHNLALVFEELLADGELELPPVNDRAPLREEEAGSTMPVEEPPAPRHYSSGLRSSDASASKPAPPQKKPLVTWEMLEKMSRVEYNERLRDPAFRRAVDALPQRQSATAR